MAQILRFCSHMVVVNASGQQASEAKSLKFKEKVRGDHVCNEI